MIHWNKGKSLSEEHKQKIREALKETAKTKRWGANKKGKFVSKETKKRMALSKLGNKYSLGLKRSEEEKAQISRKLKGRDTYWSKKEKHWNWKGGITSENARARNSIEFRLWREAVFARDNWICQKCTKRGGELWPHHIRNFGQYPELRFAIDNGITFCKKCHREFHKKYGFKRNTEEQLEEFMEQNE